MTGFSGLSSKQEAELFQALKERRQVPEKFEYLGKTGVKNYLGWAFATAYEAEYELLEKTSGEIKRFLRTRNWNIVYAGCGSGVKVIPLIKEFSKQNTRLNVVLIDMSREMLLLATKKLRKARKLIRLYSHTADFESRDIARISKSLRKSSHAKNLLLCFGNTIGIHTDARAVLVNFRKGMALSDRLLLGIHLVPKNQKKMIQTYKAPSQIKFVSEILREICGNKISVSVIWNKRKRQVEHWATMKEGFELRFGREAIELRKGEKILVGISKKFKENEARKMLKVSGFKLEKMFSDGKSKIALLLCAPARA